MATLVDCNSKISELFYVLKAEVKALRNGELHKFEDFIAQKTSGLKQLSELIGTLDEDDDVKALEPQLGRLHKLSVENGILLKSVFNGIKSANDRVQKIRTQSSQVGAYGRAGGGLYFHEDTTGREKSI